MTLSEHTILENRYRIEGLLSQGGMGAIYRAFDTNLKTPVAIKENFFQTPHSIQQFEQEALILARLRHPGLPRVIHHFSADRKQYLVMDFIEGQDLWELVQQQGPLDEAQALTYLTQICKAVSYLHNQDPSVIHRDIKPQNIKITPDDQAVLVDFGIAKVADVDSRTRTGAQAVTPGFSPPEQYAGMGTGPVSDVYALGATLYAVLVGQKPPDSISRMVGGANYEPPHRLNPKLSQAVSRAIEHAMQMQQADRPQTVEIWHQELEGVLAGATVLPPELLDPAEETATIPPTAPDPLTVTTAPEPAPSPTQKQSQATWAWLFGLGAAIIGLTLGAITLFGSNETGPIPPEQTVAPETIAQATPTTGQAVDAEATVSAALTAAAQQTQSKTEPRQADQTVEATATPLPTTATATPTETPTATPSPIPPSPTPALPVITVNSDSNVRAGPGTAYERLGELTGGTTVEIVGRNVDSSWWQISFPEAPDGLAWISATLGEARNSQAVAVVATIPPSPTPALPSPTPFPTIDPNIPPTPTVDPVEVQRQSYCPVSNEVVFDQSNEIQAPFTDIVQVSSALAGQTLTVSFTLRDLPETLPFYREGITPGNIEYAWSAFVDVDANLDTGLITGAEYALEAKAIVWSENVPTYNQAIAVGAPAEIWQCGSDGYCSPLADATLKVIPESNELILTGTIPGITPQSRLVFETRDYFAGFDEAGCPAN